MAGLSTIPIVANLPSTSGRAAVEAQVLAITRDLLREMGSTSAKEDLQGSASLERDLGLGSIERMELAARLDRLLGTTLPENVVAEARTLDDIVTAIAGPARSGAGGPPPESASASHPDDRSSVAESGAGRLVRPKTGLFWRAIETIYGIYAAAVFFVWLVITWLVVLALPPGRATARVTSLALRMYFALIGCRIVLEGREHIQTHDASIFVSNHTSYSDVLVVLALFDTDYHFVAKSEITDMPFIGTFLRKRGDFAFDRSKLRARSRQIEQMEEALLQGESVFVFAEGTFAALPGVRPFQLGAFRAAVKKGRPVVPVALRGTRRFLRDGTFLPKPSSIRVTVCPPFFPASGDAGREWAEVLRLRDETRRTISTHSGEPLVESSDAFETTSGGESP